MATLKQRNIELEKDLVKMADLAGDYEHKYLDAVSENTQLNDTVTRLSSANAAGTESCITLKEQLLDMTGQLTKAKAELKTLKSTSDYHNDRANLACGEINQMHSVFDLLGCPIPKRCKDTYTDMSVVVRMTAMMTLLPRLTALQHDPDSGEEF